MLGTVVCEVCGNNIDPALKNCPYCGSKRVVQFTGIRSEQFRVVNLEKGMPLVRDALKRLASELDVARTSGVKLLVLIHGYGSSGEGGAIKDALRQALQTYKDQNKLNEVLPGENINKHSGQTRNILKRFPEAKEYLLRSNPGITLLTT